MPAERAYCSRFTYVYRIATNTWIQAHKLREARQNASLFVQGKWLYCIGECHSVDHTPIYYVERLNVDLQAYCIDSDFSFGTYPSWQMIVGPG